MACSKRWARCPRDRLPPLDIVVREEITEPGGVRRQTITFATGDGDRVAAYLYIPPNPNRTRLPAILALHQTSTIGKGEVAGYGKSKNQAYATELAARGYVVVAPTIRPSVTRRITTFRRTSTSRAR